MGRPRLEPFALFLMLAGSVLFPWGWLVGIVLTIMPFVTAVYLNRRLAPSRRAPRLSPA